MLRTYMALLTLYENNMRCIHWRLCGTGFQTAHERFGDYYDKLGEMLDETAEMMITLGETPVNIPDAMHILEEDEAISACYVNCSGNISEAEADLMAKSMFDSLYSYAMEAQDSDQCPDDVQDVFIEHARYYRIEGKYKLGRATTQPSANPESDA